MVDFYESLHLNFWIVQTHTLSIPSPLNLSINSIQFLCVYLSVGNTMISVRVHDPELTSTDHWLRPALSNIPNSKQMWTVWTWNRASVPCHFWGTRRVIRTCLLIWDQGLTGFKDSSPSAINPPVAAFLVESRCMWLCWAIDVRRNLRLRYRYCRNSLMPKWNVLALRMSEIRSIWQNSNKKSVDSFKRIPVEINVAKTVRERKKVLIQKTRRPMRRRTDSQVRKANRQWKHETQERTDGSG